MVIATRNRKYSDFVAHPRRHGGKGRPRKEASPATYKDQGGVERSFRFLKDPHCHLRMKQCDSQDWPATYILQG